MQARRAPRLPYALVAASLVACGRSESTSADAVSDGSPPNGDAAPTGSGRATTLPNVLLVFADDLGYGDLGVYGASGIETPHLDTLAEGGVRFTRFYVASSVCSPSRASLLTGRYPARIPMDPRGVFYEDSEGGLPPEETTLAEMLRGRGYATALIGKWHLGHHPEYTATAQGFDLHYGLPYSNDMHTPYVRGMPPPTNPGVECMLDPDCRPLVPLMENGNVLEAPAIQETLTQRYVDRTLEFIRGAVSDGTPFFVYHATHAPHTPLYASEDFRGTQTAGIYGDVVAELDDRVGQLVDELESLGVADDTLVVFTSDNGPWTLWDGTNPVQGGLDGGSAGPLREGKGSTFEGGIRVPMIARWPGAIEPGRVESAPATTMDLLPTLATITGASLPDDVEIDGRDVSAMLTGDGPAPPFRHLIFQSFAATDLAGYMDETYKLKLAVVGQEAPYAVYDHDDLLFDVRADPAESRDLSVEMPDKSTEMRDAMQRLAAEVERAR